MILFLIWMLLYPPVAVAEGAVRLLVLGEEHDTTSLRRRDAAHAAVYIVTALIFLVSAHV